jgi:hypothetical protein
MNPALDRPRKESHEFQNVLIQTCELILPHNQFFTLRCTTYTSRLKSASRGTRPCLADWRQESKHQSHQEFISGLKTKVMHHPRLVQLTILLPYNEFILTRFQPTPNSSYGLLRDLPSTRTYPSHLLLCGSRAEKSRLHLETRHKHDNPTIRTIEQFCGVYGGILPE